jgi:hypothetical protein
MYAYSAERRRGRELRKMVWWEEGAERLGRQEVWEKTGDFVEE